MALFKCACVIVHDTTVRTKCCASEQHSLSSFQPKMKSITHMPDIKLPNLRTTSLEDTEKYLSLNINGFTADMVQVAIAKLIVSILYEVF